MENTDAMVPEIGGQSADGQKPRAPKNRNKHYKLFGKDYRLYDTLIGLAFIAPALVLGAIFVIAPMVISLSYAFTDATMQTLNAVNA